MRRRRARRRRSWTRSTTTPTARSSSRPIWRCGPTGPSEFPVTFFHLGRFFQKPVRMHVVEGRAGARDHLRQRLFRHAGGFARAPAAATIRALPASASRKPRDGKLDWRKNDWVAFLGASYFRAIGELYQYGLSARGLAVDVAVFGKSEEFPDFTHVYFETPQAGLGHGDGLCPARRAERRRRLPLRHAPRRRPSSWTSRRRSSCARTSPPRHRAPYLDVLVLGEVEADGRRLAARDPRFRRPRPVDGRGRAHLAAAQQPAAHHHVGLRRRATRTASGCCSATAASTTISTASITTGGRPSGSSRGRLGQGRGPARRNPDRRRDPRQHRRHVGAGRAGPGGPVLRRSSTGCTGPPTSPIPTPLARCVATRLGNGGQAGTVRPKGVRKFMVEFKGEPLDPPRQGRDPAAGPFGLARSVLQHPHRGGAQRRARALARPVRPHRRPGTDPSRCAASCAAATRC